MADQLPARTPGDIEAHWRVRWEECGIYRYDSARPREETFVVDTPPPTVSGSLHVGHVFSYSHQDFLVRFWRMRGKNIFYPMGWDDNGLPTERRVENMFNVRCSPNLPYDPGFDIAPGREGPPVRCSRRNFIELCARVTAQDELAYKEMWQRLGLSIDWSLEYATINAHARHISQLSFLRLFESGEVYASEAPLYWDPTFQTAIAQAEIEDREVPAHFFTLKFGLSGGGHVAIATTRPELLPACVAVMVHPEDERYSGIIGQVALTPIFAVPVPILADPKVQRDKGTGVVMVCTFGDTTDAEWWREHKLPLRQILNQKGRIDPIPFGEPGWPSQAPEAARRAAASLAGIDLMQARVLMTDLLRAEGAMIGDPKAVTHAVKFYEKGNKPLEILTTRQWFVRLLDKKDALIAQGDCIDWHPSFMRERYRDWVKGLNQDWCISRQRYFGVPFPLWYPVDERGIPVYDCPILANQTLLPVDPMSDTPSGYEPSQRNKPGGFVGEPDVLDTWATSSLTPQISSSWHLDTLRHHQLYPMDLRPQSHEIIRTWAFYTIAMSWMHERSVPWHHVAISGWILDPDRKKMSKSKGNVVTPTHLLDTYTADAVRYWAARARPGVDTAFDETVYKVGKRLTIKLTNAARFVAGCLTKAGSPDLSLSAIQLELDRALISRLRQVITEVTEAYECYDWATPLAVVEKFFWAEYCVSEKDRQEKRGHQVAQSVGNDSTKLLLTRQDRP